MDVINALNWRYAVRAFSQQKVSECDVDLLLEAVRLSPSSYGLQPYKLILIRSPDVRQQLLPFSFGQKKVMACSHLIVLAASTCIDELMVDRYLQTCEITTGQSKAELIGYGAHIKQALNAMSDRQKQEWAHQQSYIALGNLLTSAALMRIDTCPMAGIDVAGYDQVLGLAEKGLTTSVICPIGYRSVADKQAEKEKVRTAFSDLILEY